MKLYPGSRRQFLQFLGRGGAFVGLSGFPLLQSCASLLGKESTLPHLAPSESDSVVLAPDFQHRILIRWGDSIGSGRESFGFNNDYIALVPISENEAYMWVNHESVDPVMMSGLSMKEKRPKEVIDAEREAVGGSLLILRKNTAGGWSVDAQDPRSRRWSGTTPIPLRAPRDIAGSRMATGTLGNCAGGVTPWQTFLTCEENYQDFYGELISGSTKRKTSKHSFGWEEHYPLPPEHYGWVVEIDPRTHQAQKLTALGRFCHEGATTVLAQDGRCVVYMGDDANDECVYKFISEKPGSLLSGTLYVADFKRGQWLPVDHKTQPLLKKKFRDQTDTLVHTREAAKILGGTPMNRPEDIEIDPKTGDIFVAFTNNKKRGDQHGSIVRISEANRDFTSLGFSSASFVVGSPKSGISCPDNMAFDRLGNLWVTTDISGSSLYRGEYKSFGGNSLFYIPLSGPRAGLAHRVASAPRYAEFTGPCFTPDGTTLLLSVQHPGETSSSRNELKSHWPDGGSSLPRPAVIALDGPGLTRLLGVQGQA